MSNRSREEPDIIEHLSERPVLRLIKTPEAPRPEQSSEMKAALEDIRRRYQEQRERVTTGSDDEDAA